jgi:hypothetical protein
MQPPIPEHYAGIRPGLRITLSSSTIMDKFTAKPPGTQRRILVFAKEFLSVFALNTVLMDEHYPARQLHHPGSDPPATSQNPG